MKSSEKAKKGIPGGGAPAGGVREGTSASVQAAVPVAGREPAKPAVARTTSGVPAGSATPASAIGMPPGVGFSSKRDDRGPSVPEPVPARATSVSPPSHDAIARRAFELFVHRGGELGHEQDDWFLAERELSREIGVS